MLLANAIVWQVANGTLYEVIDVGAGVIYPPPGNYTSKLTVFLHIEIAVNLLYSFGIYAIKLSFMIFFLNLGNHLRGQKLLWCCILVAVIAAFSISLGVYNWPCLTMPIDYEIANCATESFESYTILSLRIITGCDVITDILISIIPINILWNVQLRTRQKVALLALIFFTAFVMVCSIIRVAIAVNGFRVDSTWMYTWGPIEQAVAIIIACLVSYHPLFDKGSVSHARYTASSSLQTWRHRLSMGPDGWIRNNTTIEGGKTLISSGSFGDEFLPIDAIKVRYEFAVFPQSKAEAV
ncbi:hypothetical protein MMC18_004574 [Xylographa bjoerkii]|nr:hypothetical protein [Xylographa bjoerkii]